jgi:hypothetical protein
MNFEDVAGSIATEDGKEDLKMSDMGEIYNEMKEEQKERRAKRLPGRTAEILSLKNDGFDVEQLTEYQFRINGRLDLFPTHNRYHDTRKNVRGGYGAVIPFVKKFFEMNP